MRSLTTPLIKSLMEEEPFRYAHLVKFEKPIKTESGKPTKAAVSYSYITDASVDISFDDGSSSVKGIANGSQTYIASRLLDVSSISETIEARASNFSITIGAAALRTTLSATFTIAGSGPYTITSNKNLVEAGFLEGDEIYVTGVSPGWTGRIDRFVTASGIPNATAYVTLVEGTTASTATNILLNTKDIGAILLDKTDSSYARYINREVYVYKAHININTGAIIGDPFLLFKGIVTSGSLTEDPTSDSKMVWSISSHWGDWLRVNGRITSDSSHRALSSNGTSDRSALIRPEYADDLGFLHSEQALNIMASYKVSETRYKMKKSGLFGLKVKMKEYQVQVDREVDLRFNLEAKYLPVVYGVQRLDSIPFFVDTDKYAPNKVYAAYALCEGEIGGIFDIYFGDQSSICLDADDSAVRSTDTTANIDVICSGRADRGDVLEGQTVIDSTSPNYADILKYNFGQLTLGTNLFAANSDRRFFGRDVGFTGSVAATVTPLGITHEKGRSFTDPVDSKFVVHTGKAEQRADDILVAKAQNNEFKVQGDYYAGDKSQYWGANHRVLDTAYVTAEYILSEGEEELPSVEFIVKGKAVECYNYDYSYIHDPAATGQTAPTIGSTVVVGATSVVVADVFNDEFGQARVRFLTDPNVTSASFSITTPNYTLLASNAVLISGTVPAILSSAVVSSTFSPAAQTYNITTATSGIGLYGANLADIRFTILNTLLSDTSTLTAEQKNQIRIAAGGSSVASGTSTTTVSGITNNTNASPSFVVVKNGIRLASGASTTNDAYNGFIIELTRTNTDGSTVVQRRTITDYVGGTTLTATVDRDWDAVYYPRGSETLPADTYKIYAPSDKRITNNPAMQLLDYITSVRYGRGLDVVNDINLETFKSAARKCDTRSDVTVTTSTQATIGDIYTYSTKFRGTVSSSTLINGIYQTTFTDVIGKLGNKWFDWKTYAVGDLIWDSGAVYIAAATGPFSSAASISSAISTATGFTLSRVGGGTITVSIASASFEGNPIVKKYISGSKSYISGYSLYDCDEVKYWRYVGWNEQNQRHVTRHQTNVIVNTSTPVFDNINMLLAHFDGILRYNSGKYELDVQARHYSTSGVYGSNQVSTDVTNLTTWVAATSTRTTAGISGPTGGDGIVIQCTESISGTAVAHGIRTDISTVDNNDVIVCSTYLKLTGTYQGAIRVIRKDNTTAWGFFDLTNSVSKVAGTGVLTSGIYAVGSGWYRCWVATNAGTGATAAKFDILMDDTYADSTGLYIAAAATNSIYISGPMVEYYRALNYLEGPTSLIYYPNIIGEEDIIGAISIEDPGNKDTFNTISVDIPDPRNRFEERSVTYFNSTYLVEDNSVPKKGDMKSTGITNYFNARMNAKQYLEQSRYGLKINFTMPPKGALIMAGEIIEITNSRLGFSSKPFRVTNLTVNKDCLVQISADEHTNNAYSISPSSGGVFSSSEPSKGISLAPLVPTSPSASDNKTGVIVLNWVNPLGYNPLTDTVEIYRATGASSLRINSNLISVATTGITTYSDPIAGSADTFYNYWLRSARDSYKAATNSNVKATSAYTATIGGKVLASSNNTVYRIVVSAPVIVKDAPSITTSGAHTNITVSGSRTIGNTTSPFGFVVIYGNGDSPASSGSPSITTNIANNAGKSYYTAKLYDTSPLTNLLDSQDIPVVFKGATGINAISAILSNESHVLPASPDGSINSYVGSGTQIRIYEGASPLTYTSTGTSPSTFTIGTPVGTNITPGGLTGLNTIIGTVSPASSMLIGSDTANITYPISGTISTGQTFSITKLQTFSKAKSGTSGISGSPAQYVVVSGEQAFKYLSDAVSPTITNIILSAELYGGLTAYNWQYFNSSVGQWSPFTSNVSQTFNLAYNNAAFTNDLLRVRCLSSPYSDETTIIKLYDGTKAKSGYLTNEVYAAPTNSSGGSPDYSGGIGTFKVFNGATDITTASGTTYSIISTNPVNGLTLAINSSTGVYSPSGSAWSTNTENFTLRAVTNAINGGVTLDKIYTISKSKDGVPGSNTATVALYAKNTSSVAAPSAFSGTFTYTFSTSTLSGGTLNGWTTTPPTLTKGEYLWARYAVASSNTNGDTIDSTEFSTAVIAAIGGIDGINTATVALYAKNADSVSPPSTFAGTFTYTFSPPALTGGTLNGWATTAPSITKGEYLWARYGVAASNTNTDNVTTAEFSSAVITSIGGSDGSPGANGVNTATIGLYAKNSSSVAAPSAFSGTFTYTFSPPALTGGTLNGWATTAPSITKGEYLWARYATAASTTNTDAIATAEFSAAIITSIGGTDGINTATVGLYAKNADSVSPPSAFSGTFTYTFSPPALTGGTLNGWATTAPSITKGEYLWARYGVAASNTNTDSIATAEFSTEAVIGVGGADGTNGINTATIALYAKNADSVSPPSAFSGTFTYTFSPPALTGGTLNGWSTTASSITNNEYLWVRYGVASSTTNTDSVATAEFSSAIIAAVGGANGSSGIDGVNTATIGLYAKNTSSVTPPTAFSGTFTYTFSPPALSGGTLNTWATTAPSITNGDYLWARYATAASNTNTDSIAATEFSTAVVSAVGGTNGANGINTATVALYAKNTSSVSAPTAFSGTFTYTFSSSALTGGTLLTWSTTAPGITNGEYLWVRYATAASSAASVNIAATAFSTAAISAVGGANGTNGGPGFFFLKRAGTGITTGTPGTDLGAPSGTEVPTPASGHCAIVENSNAAPSQLAWKYTTSWAQEPSFIRTGVISADAISTGQLLISNIKTLPATGLSGIYMASDKIDIYAVGVLRVRLGLL